MKKSIENRPFPSIKKCESDKLFSADLEERRKGKGFSFPLSKIHRVILFDQIFGLQPIHGHIMNLLMVYIHSLV